MGLAMWHTAELYEDIQYVTHKTKHRLLTALNNKYDQNCTSKDDCHGKLIWQQEKNGPEEHYNFFFPKATAFLIDRYRL